MLLLTEDFLPDNFPAKIYLFFLKLVFQAFILKILNICLIGLKIYAFGILNY